MNVRTHRNIYTALVLTVLLLCSIVGLGLRSVIAEENSGYKATDLTVKQNSSGAWCTFEKNRTLDKQTLTEEPGDIAVTNYTGIASNEYGWWRIENGKVNFKANGLYSNDLGTWYVKKGKCQFTYTGLLQANYNIDKTKGSPLYSDPQGNSLSAMVETTGTNAKAAGTEKSFWKVTKGKVETGYTGAKKGTLNKITAWWRIENGRINQKYNGVAKNEYGWWYFKDGRVDFSYTGVARNNLGWWRIEDGKVNFKYNGVASNEYGSWYLENGKVNFSYTGAFVLDETMYVVEKGKVVSSQKLTLKELSPIRPKVSYSYDGANVSWSAVKGVGNAAVDGYEVYVKNNPTAKWNKVATVDGKTLSFHHSLGSNLDPSQNTKLYDVRAIQKNKWGVVVARGPENTQTAANNYVGGGFGLYAPDIVSVSEAAPALSVTFKKVPYALRYDIYYGTYNAKGGVANLVKAGSAKAEASGAGTAEDAARGFQKGNQTIKVLAAKDYDFITVQAVSSEPKANGYPALELKSVYDKGFQLNQKQLAGQKILFLGDSLICGTPYGPSTSAYTIPTRVAQQTGAKVYNVAVGGAVIVSDYPRVVNNSILHNQTLPVSDGTHEKLNDGQWDVKNLTDFDMVLLEGGPNDFFQSVALGTIDSTDVKTFYGALNKHLATFKEASRVRQQNGKSRTKVILMDILYTPQGYHKNRKGLDYVDYAAAIKAIADKYDADPDIDVYYYTGHESILNENTYTYATVDSVHPSAYWYGQLGNHMAAFLKTLQPKEHPEEVTATEEPTTETPMEPATEEITQIEESVSSP